MLDPVEKKTRKAEQKSKPETSIAYVSFPVLLHQMTWPEPRVEARRLDTYLGVMNTIIVI